MRKNSSLPKILSNEKGAALVLVLIVVALLMFFSTVIMNSILTQSKHNQVSETDYHAVHLAEMGAEFTRAKLSEYVQENDFDPSLEALYYNDLFNMIEKESKRFVVDDEFPDRGFVITEDDRKNTSYEMTENGAEVFFQITGNDGVKEKDLFLTFNIRFAGSGGDGSVDDWERESEDFPSMPDDPKPDTVYVGEDGKTYKNERNATSGDFYADGKIHVANNTTLTIFGIGVFNQGLSYNANKHTKVFIRDHAYFNDKLTLHNNKHAVFIACGSTRFKNGLEYGAQFGVRQHLVADEPVRFDKETVYVGGDAIFHDGLYFNHKHGVLEVGGDVTVYVDGDPQGYFDDNIIGQIKVVGDLTIYGNGDTLVNPLGTVKINQLSNPTYAGPCDPFPLPEIIGGEGGNPGADLVDGEY